jgi:hypothetical protein
MTNSIWASFHRGNDMQINITGATDPHGCELCGKRDELRPFGPHGESICFECGMKDPETTEAMFETRLTQAALSMEDVGAVLRGTAARN